MVVTRIISFVVGPLDTNCYLVYDENEKKGIVIDPGGDEEELSELLTWIDRLKLDIVAVIATHGHFDHILGVEYVVKELGAPFYMNPKDLAIARDSAKWATAFGYRKPSIPSSFSNLVDGTKIVFGSLEAVAIETPGHTPGSTCIYIPHSNILFTGDTLFAGTVGRTDLPGGSHSELMKSLAKLFTSLPLETIVYPGHGPQTNLLRELRANPFVEDSLRVRGRGEDGRRVDEERSS